MRGYGFLSQHARKALNISCQKSGVSLPDLPKDENGAPKPVNGYYWSIAHKPDYVAGIVAAHPVGIDIEPVKPLRVDLKTKVATPEEWALVDAETVIDFFRIWTAKEAAIKASGQGLRDLSRCRVTQILDPNHIMLHYQTHDLVVEHFFFDNHIAAIVINDSQIQWEVIG